MYSRSGTVSIYIPTNRVLCAMIGSLGEYVEKKHGYLWSIEMQYMVINTHFPIINSLRCIIDIP